MRVFNNTLLILVYLLTGLSPCAGNAVVNISETFYISQKKPAPKTHYFTSAKINKHILPVQHAEQGVALLPGLTGDEPDHNEFKLPALSIPVLHTREVLTVSNKAPPLV